MKLKECALYLLAAGLMSAGGGVIAGTEEKSSFAALQSVEAQSLSTQEMQAIAGQLNAYDIAAALLAAAAKYPRVAATLTSAANETLAHAAQLNALFAKFHVLTPCKSCP